MGNRYCKTLKMEYGEKFGELTFIEEVGSKEGRRMGKFRCSCGNVGDKIMSDVNIGHTNSCGCYRLKKLREKKITHGMNGTKIYRVFCSMKQRCTNKNNKKYKDYGGRGIKCEWDTFEEFYKDIGDSYKEGLSIERIDNNGNYRRGNCRRASNLEQMNNTRTNRLYKGKSMKKWCDELGISYSTVKDRIYRQGKTLKQSLLL